MRPLLVTFALCVGCTGSIDDDVTTADASPGVGPDADAGTTPADAGLDTRSPASPTDSGTPCLAEAFDGAASLADLKSSSTPSNWLPTVLSTLERRYPDGHALLEAMKSDPDLARWPKTSSWSALMASIDTMCHEETHAWDFAQSKTSATHVYWMRKDLAIEVPTGLGFFPRAEILSMVGDADTSLYDGEYLKGELGKEDFVFLADELTAYINGLACSTSVASEITETSSLRDGPTAHLYYLELYLKRARTVYPALWAKMKASPEWVRFVRWAWARGHFWMKASEPYPHLAIHYPKIRPFVDAQQGEIELFTGQKADEVACHP